MKTGRTVTLQDAADAALVLCFAAFIVCMAVTTIADYDIWWHLKLGETVFRDASIYRVDAFSYTFTGRPQFNGEWLGDLAWYLSYQTAGAAGVTAFKALLLLGTMWLLVLAIRWAIGKEEWSGLHAALIALTLVAFALRFRLFPRPFLFSFLFVSAFLYALQRYDRTRDIRVLYALPLLELFWANMSKGAFYGTLIASLYLAAELAGRRTDRRLFLIVGLVVVASLVNPGGIAVYTMPFGVSTNQQLAEVVGEHQPLTADLLWGGGLTYTLGFQLMVAGCLCYFAFLGGWRNLFLLVLFLLFLAQAVKMVRMIDFFAITNAIALSLLVHRALAFLRRRVHLRRTAAAVTLAAALSVMIPTTVLNSRTYAFGFGVKETQFPGKALAFLDREHIGGRMFNSYAYGGYLIWHAPHRKVFVDGRGIGALYSDAFYNRYFAMLKDPVAWDAALREWQFDYAVLDYDMLSRRYPRHLAHDPKWVPVYWDGHSVVLLRRTEANRTVIDRYGYHVARPTLYEFDYVERLPRAGAAPAMLREFDRDIALNLRNQEPRLAKVFYLFLLGPSFYPEALQELDRTVALPPDMAMEHSARALLLSELGRPDEARQALSRALALDPSDLQARALLRRLQPRP